jgi:hypothetical protein
MADPLVRLAVSRDLDSQLNEREVAALQEWLQSGTAMHIMRDHPLHTWPILGKLWHIHLFFTYNISSFFG